jgi:hypothetical protein
MGCVDYRLDNVNSYPWCLDSEQLTECDDDPGSWLGNEPLWMSSMVAWRCTAAVGVCIDSCEERYAPEDGFCVQRKRG